MSIVEMWTNLGSAIAGIMFAWAMFQQYFPYQFRGYLDRYTRKLVAYVYPYLQITFHEYTGERLKRSELYANIQNYLSATSSTTAKRLKADVVKDGQSLILSMDDHEEITDEYNGIKVWWASSKTTPKSQTISWYPEAEERRYFKLTVHRRHRDIITTSYIDHVLKEGKTISIRNRQRKLYTNNPSQNWYGWKASKWSHVVFEHPATFDTLGMATKKKQEIKNDLIKFSKGKEYYAKIGKAWKRGYLLYGPPGTGKSTMIAAMANFLNYDVYDLELTTVKDNSELRKLLIETTSKSIIVIEDIDCSLDLTGQRKPKKEKDDDDDDNDDEKKKDPVSKKKKKDEDESNKGSKVTLSGLLNFIDGIWSACGGERIIVFTTNYVEKLDPALIRRGRMDKHIEMSYCCFEAFKVLAKNYLDVESHELYGKISKLLEETNMTPADVAENLMPKSDEEDEDTCLKNLIAALEETKEEEARKKAEEAKLKAEQEAKEKEKASKEDEKGNVKSDKEIKENGITSNGEKQIAP
ncbi:AAA-ATPase ASD, mitochondrial [Ricinus communis]|uniref:ATP binding protein, putative n=1 Tax=Ricinus communis TaxID=3988 RepID=B9RUJ6_RICCO|nr:AAA-ATPase ASD, mitochondrial [Ricinus communis]EEF44983.1 ATP binding protein, putative [Ricinus communis]|eukprot:XP_002517441.1 AAA-ATPase ASD, mitochondrial [Ricinus communis]